MSIYSHYDNYPEFAGRILRTHYNTREKVENLIDGGDVSCLWTDERWNFDGSSVKVEEYGPQYYVRKIDEDCPPRLDANLNEYLSEGEEYAYIYTLKGEWICYNRHEFDDSKLPELTEIPSAALAV